MSVIKTNLMAPVGNIFSNGNSQRCKDPLFVENPYEYSTSIKPSYLWNDPSIDAANFSNNHNRENQIHYQQSQLTNNYYFQQPSMKKANIYYNQMENINDYHVENNNYYNQQPQYQHPRSSEPQPIFASNEMDYLTQNVLIPTVSGQNPVYPPPPVWHHYLENDNYHSGRAFSANYTWNQGYTHQGHMEPGTNNVLCFPQPSSHHFMGKPNYYGEGEIPHNYLIDYSNIETNGQYAEQEGFMGPRFDLLHPTLSNWPHYLDNIYSSAMENTQNYPQEGYHNGMEYSQNLLDTMHMQPSTSPLNLHHVAHNPSWQHCQKFFYAKEETSSNHHLNPSQHYQPQSHTDSVGTPDLPKHNKKNQEPNKRVYLKKNPKKGFKDSMDNLHRNSLDPRLNSNTASTQNKMGASNTSSTQNTMEASKTTSIQEEEVDSTT